MASWLDIERLRKELQERLGLALVARQRIIDGGDFETLRPRDLEEGNGFAVIFGRTSRQVEASFRADDFAASLLAKMSEADEQARGTFNELLRQAHNDGAHVYLGIDGTSFHELQHSSNPWRRFELDVSRRTLPRRVAENGLYESTLYVASVCFSLTLSLLPVETVEEPSESDAHGLPEGARVKVEVNRYERSPANRAACIAHYGPICQVCGFDFQAFYGLLGEGYIEVHHRVPVSQIGDSYFVNPVRDLVPVCANCHAMLHRTNPPTTVESLREVIAARKVDLETSSDTAGRAQ